MSEPLTLDLLDEDGAIREALDEGTQATRADVLRRAIVGGGTFLAGGVLIGGLPKVALGKPSAKQDAAIPVEARHAGWIRHLAAAPAYPNAPADYPAPGALDPALTSKQVEGAVAATGFVGG